MIKLHLLKLRKFFRFYVACAFLLKSFLLMVASRENVHNDICSSAQSDHSSSFEQSADPGKLYRDTGRLISNRYIDNAVLDSNRAPEENLQPILREKMRLQEQI